MNADTLGERLFNDHIRANASYGMEIIPYTLYDTMHYVSDNTLRLEYFHGRNVHPALSNMEGHNVLPNPQCFLIQSIAIHGITSNLQFGCCRLDIGMKHYGYNPAWRYALKGKGLKCVPNLLIPICWIFKFSIEWEKPAELGNGLFDTPKLYHPIQVNLIGQLARPIQ